MPHKTSSVDEDGQEIGPLTFGQVDVYPTATTTYTLTATNDINDTVTAKTATVTVP